MAILTGPEIVKEVEAGNITIDPFDASKVGPNSYDVHLAPILRVYNCTSYGYLDSKAENYTTEILIPQDGRILLPGVMYLGSTTETAGSSKYVTMLDGRSSFGRLGLSVHITAGVGDVGFRDTPWTFELTVVHPLKIYPNSRIAQVYFFSTQGDLQLYKGKYLNDNAAVASRAFMDKE